MFDEHMNRHQAHIRTQAHTTTACHAKWRRLVSSSSTHVALEMDGITEQKDELKGKQNDWS